MKALTVIPKIGGSLKLRDIQVPEVKPGELLCEMKMVGICGTDVEISSGLYGESPVGDNYLVIGHESLAQVIAAPPGSDFKTGDFVVGFVRRPDPLPCAHCRAGEWDMCGNGLYQERGIKGLHGYASERFVLEENYCLKLSEKIRDVGVLIEPTSVVAKAWEQTLRISNRSDVPPKTVLVTGAGPVGLLAAMIGKQKGFEVHVFDRVQEGPKPTLVRELGAVYHTDLSTLEKSGVEFDILLECTGAPELILNLFHHIKSNGTLCLAGVSSGGREFPVDIGELNLKLVLQNEVIFGSVNANRRHYQEAQKYLLAADPEWLSRMITRRVTLENFKDAFEKKDNDIKVVLVNGTQHAADLSG